MMSLCAEILKVWQPIQTHSLQLVRINFGVTILVHQLEYCVHDMIRLLLVFDIVL